jgi:hypothetical protein
MDHLLPAQPSATVASDLVSLVDLKWLMAGHGLWVDIPRLMHDRVYVQHTFDTAQGLPSELIRLSARRSLTPLM